MKSYTFELYRIDRRTKEGKKFISSFDMEMSLDQAMEVALSFNKKLKVLVEVKETYVERTNAMTGKKFMERYDTPYCCSPSSEAFFSM